MLSRMSHILKCFTTLSDSWEDKFPDEPPVVLALQCRTSPHKMNDGKIYGFYADQTYRRVALAAERPGLMFQAHAGVAGGYLSGKTTAKKLLSSGV
ncbi:hypothetical protein R1flu_015699 [Riccia fluitans]|uniref:Uncharacterized protein n=1 Tax=Riccia fluitans TaxID=41844 RepID=A0ABD1YK65_9MARC